MDFDFDPAAFDAEKAESEKPLEEISSSDIAHQTLKAVCREQTETDAEADALWEDISCLYSMAYNIEQETLGRDTGPQGRTLVGSLVSRKGEELFKICVKEEQGGTDA